MKTKRPYKPRNDNARLLKDCHDTIGVAVDAWDVPDSPEGFCYAMKGLMNLKERIAARLGLASESDCVAAGKADGKRDREREVSGPSDATACSAGSLLRCYWAFLEYFPWKKIRFSQHVERTC